MPTLGTRRSSIELKPPAKVSEKDLKSWTQRMTKVSALGLVMKKFQEGEYWSTITGDPGDGKTVLGYMVLRALKSENTFLVHTPEELKYVLKSQTDYTVMLDDILGSFTLDKSRLDKCLPLFKNIIESQEKATDTGTKPRVLLISRWDVLESAKDYISDLDIKILDTQYLINISDLQDTWERLSILNNHLERKHKSVSGNVKRKVASLMTPHGFPHCCKMYADLEIDIDIEEFFNSPLKFLEQTTESLVQNESNVVLFKSMIAADGKLNVLSIKDDKQVQALKTAASGLDASFIKNTSGIYEFTHPSIYESVLSVIGKKHSGYIVDHGSISVIMQMVHLMGTDVTLPRVISIDPKPDLLHALCERFQSQILRRNFAVFEHRFCDSHDFCEILVRKILETMRINEKSEWGHTLLSTAVLGGRYTAVPVLLDEGADVNIADEDGLTPLNCLCKRHKPDVTTIKLLIAHGAKVNIADKCGITPLHYFCEGGKPDFSTVQLLITQDANVNTADAYGMTPLHCLSVIGKPDIDVMKLLIAHGADVNNADAYGKTALHYLCRSSEPDVSSIRLVITPETDVNRTDDCGMNPLTYLCKSGKPDVRSIRLLFSHGASVNTADEYGRTALQYLCGNANADVNSIQMLITPDTDVNEVDGDGKTPLHYLCETGRGDASTTQLLIKKDASVNTTDKIGCTPLHYLQARGRINADVAHLLITDASDEKSTAAVKAERKDPT